MLVLNGGMVVKEVFDTSYEHLDTEAERREVASATIDIHKSYWNAKQRLDAAFAESFQVAPSRINMPSDDVILAAEDTMASAVATSTRNDKTLLYPSSSIYDIEATEDVYVIDPHENAAIDARVADMQQPTELFVGYTPVGNLSDRVERFLDAAHIAGQEIIEEIEHEETEDAQIYQLEEYQLHKVPTEAWGAIEYNVDSVERYFGEEDAAVATAKAVDLRKLKQATPKKYIRRRIVSGVASILAVSGVASVAGVFFGVGSYITSAGAALAPNEPSPAPVVETVDTNETMLAAPTSTTIYIEPTTTTTVAPVIETTPARSTIQTQEVDCATTQIYGIGIDKITEVATYMLDEHQISVRGAAMLTGNFMTESRLDPTTVGDSGLARGLGQWRGGRQAGMPADLYGQIDFAIDTEMERDGLNDLRSTLDDHDASVEQIERQIQRWERYGVKGERTKFGKQVLSYLVRCVGR